MANKIRSEGFLRFPLYPLEEAPPSPGGAAVAPQLCILRGAAGCDADTDTLLANILKALKLDQERDCYTRLLDERPPVQLPQLVASSGCQRCVVFGYAPRALGVQWQWPLYRVLSRSGCHYLFADNLEKIGADSARKRALWEGLQVLMQIE